MQIILHIITTINKTIPINTNNTNNNINDTDTAQPPPCGPECWNKYDHWSD